MEMEDWTGLVNYIMHQDVLKPTSATMKLRVVSSSSLNNNNSGWSYNSILHKRPNSLVLLLQSIVMWRFYQHTVVWDLNKAYLTVHTGVEEMHMMRIVIL